MKIIVHEIFLSIEGETVSSGFTALFIRLSGCNLNCSWCDTPDAKKGGNSMSLETIIREAANFPSDHITITGGEPLCQENAIYLMNELIERGYRIQVETNGSISVKDVPARVRKIIDVKTPSSGEEKSFYFGNLPFLNKGDEIKFVIADQRDYEFSKDFMRLNPSASAAVINFSPAGEKMDPAVLASMILRDRLPVRLNLQIHKIIWGDNEGKARCIDSLKQE